MQDKTVNRVKGYCPEFFMFFEVKTMFMTLFPDIPDRRIIAQETALCKVCGKNTLHRYEEVSFHARALFVKLFSYKQRYVKICSKCNNGQSMEKSEFYGEVERIFGPDYRKSKQAGITYCPVCGEKIYPDIGYCTSCAVRGPGTEIR